MGWSNGVQRWAEILEASATLGFYSYDTGGNVTGSYNLTPQGQLSSSLGTYWHSGNFNPATKADVSALAAYAPLAGAAFTGSIAVKTSPTFGSVNLVGGNNAQNPGYIEFLTGENTRRGYIGFNNGASRLLLQGDNGWSFEFGQAARAPEFHSYNGAVSTQQPLRRMGWSNGVQRWAEILEASASLSFYAYNTDGSIPGTYTLTPQGQLSSSLGTYWHSGNFGRPQAAAGVGQYVFVNPGFGAGYTLPAGGTWAFFWIYLTTSGAFVGSLAGVAAGGTGVGGTAGQYIQGFSWRIA
jgi:hypothetical protein